jgi:hypothetical protein
MAPIETNNEASECLCQFWADCITNTSGFSFRQRQRWTGRRWIGCRWWIADRRRLRWQILCGGSAD